jgi:hypothetical protein
LKNIVAGLALINGLWMLIDGIYVLANGKYIGPEKPGPWASLLGMTGIDVFRLGPLFVLFGVLWLTFSGSIFVGATWARTLGLVLSVMTLWYLPFGTLISIVVLIGLALFLKS